MRKFLCYAFLLFLLSNCTSKYKVQTIDSETMVDYVSSKKKTFADIPDSLLSPPKFVLLDTLNTSCFFGHISKVMISNERIYILDFRLRKLVVFDMTGKAVGAVGKRGQGPEEYLGITDFDISDNGDIYFIDGIDDRLFHYDNNFHFISKKKLPFEADALALTSDQCFLFGLSSWNKGVGKGVKIIKADSDFNIKEACINYDEFTDPSYWISFYTFIKTSDCISYNQTIDNHIYLFDYNGTMIDCIDFDFSDLNVPDEVKKSVEINLDKFDDYCLLKEYTIVTERMIAGTLWNRRKTIPFIYDREHDICYQAEEREDYDNSVVTGYSDNMLISYYAPGTEVKEELPDSVFTHLKCGGFVITLRQMK